MLPSLFISYVLYCLNMTHMFSPPYFEILFFSRLLYKIYAGRACFEYYMVSAEVITSAEFHPIHCNMLAYSSSKGSIRLIDMRQSALCDSHTKL